MKFMQVIKEVNKEDLDTTEEEEAESADDRHEAEETFWRHQHLDYYSSTLV